MPLFSSKFAFRKSSTRKPSLISDDSYNESKHRNAEKDQNKTNQANVKKRNKNLKSDRTHSPSPTLSTSSSKSTKSSTNSERNKKKNIKNKSKNGNKNFLKKSNSLTSKSKNINQNLLLYLDESEGIGYQFEPKLGVWNEINPVKSIPVPVGVNENKLSTPSPDLVSKPEMIELINKNKQIEEENRLLKLKIEILMEMVTETTAELNLKDKNG